MTYEPANPVTVPAAGRCRAGVAAFSAWYQATWGLPSSGCYNPASVLPGGSPSLHRDGRAEDVSHDGTEYQVGLVWELCDRLIAHHERLGVQQIIYRKMFWRQGQGWKSVSPTTDPHWSHAHVEFLIRQSDENTEQDYRETIGERPMTKDEIQELARAIVTEFMEYPIKQQDYDAGKETTLPIKSRIAFGGMELSQIRRALTAG